MITDDMRDILVDVLEDAKLDHMAVTIHAEIRSITITVVHINEADFDELREMVEAQQDASREGHPRHP
jgi:hypothetical protein